MAPADRVAFAKAMLAMGEVYGRTFSEPTVELYWRALERYAASDVLAAFDRHVLDPDHGQFMPKPADIVRQIDGSGDSQAMRAWTKALTAVRRVGVYQTVVFDDWRIHAVIADMGGWLALGTIVDDELPFKAREFEKRYRGYRAEAAYPRRLIGRIEAENAAKNHPVDPPVLIGDPARAALVYQQGDERRALQLTAMPVTLLQLPRPQDDAA